MKKIINTLEIIFLTTISINNIISCSNKKTKIINQTEKLYKKKTIIEKINIKNTQKATEQQFADEISNIINKKKYIYKNDYIMYNDAIKNYLNTLIPNKIEIKNLNTDEFNKKRIEFENIYWFYSTEKEIKNIIIKYNNVESKIKINLIIIKKEENDLNKMINRNLGEIKLKNNIPNKIELIKFIKKDNFVFQKIKEDDFEILKQDENSTIISGKKKYKGIIKLIYKRKIINLNNSFIEKNQNIFLNFNFFKKQNIDVSSIHQKDVKKLIINYLNETYGEFMLQFVLPDIDLKTDIKLDFKKNIFPFNLKEKKEIEFSIIGINNAKGLIEIKLTYLN